MTSLNQAAAVPVRIHKGRYEFCLITSLKRRHWIFPKGLIDPGETAKETALKEAFEEAGLHGKIVGCPLGRYRDKKWGQTLKVTGLLMRVTDVDSKWAEDDVRSRKWVTAKEALALLARPEHRKLLATALDQLSDKSALFA